MDSLRGIAAAAVLARHALECAGVASPDPRWAVMFFFVLSGFVLAIPFVEKRQASWGDFLIGRC
jgi:peptidoglycan/LPS O-acetylase OafA/YrhL